jgi:hypothetical protein
VPHAVRLVAPTLVAVLALSALPAAAQSPEIFVADDQVVTLAGSAPSLRDVVGQLCTGAVVELRLYGAPDRPFAGNFQSVPLTELLPRLLREESYAVGMRAAANAAAPRIAWISVMGISGQIGRKPPSPAPVAVSKNTAASDDEPARAGAELAASELSVLLLPAFAASDDAVRKRQVARIVQQLSERPETKQMLVDADIGIVGRALAHHPTARGVFAEIQSGVTDPEVQKRLNAIAGALNGALAASQTQPR